MTPKAQAARMLLSLLTAGVLGLAGVGPAGAASENLGPGKLKHITWTNHAAPLNFLFGNAFDNYQETQLNSDGTLSGYLYIQFTGQTTSDGYPVAVHNNCLFLASLCQAGWTISGRPGQASFASMAMFGRDLIWQTKAGDVPQPGAYSVFQQLGLPATTEMTSPMMEAMLSTTQPPPRTQGYFLQITAEQSFCFRSDPTADQKMVDMMVGQMQRLQPLMPAMMMPGLPGGGPGGVQDQMMQVMLGQWDSMMGSMGMGGGMGSGTMLSQMATMSAGMTQALGYGAPGPVDSSKTCTANGGYPVNMGVDIASHTNFYRGL